MAVTNKQVVKAMMALCDIVEETAREAGPMGIPSGHLYAALSSAGISLDNYQKMLAAMEKVGRIQVSGHVITAK